jgi:hypothetical protein
MTAWRVLLRQCISRDTPSRVLGADGKPLLVEHTYGEQTEVQCHAPDEASARAHVEQQNPLCTILGAEKVP